MKIGLTGMIGSGKSTAADYFKKHSFKVINADDIGKSVVNNSQSLRNKLAHEFGQDILTDKGNLRRKMLARKAFSSESLRQKLNSIVHPYLLKEIHVQYKYHCKMKHKIILDAALLLEWNLERLFDYVICIHATEKIRFKRMVNRGFTRTEIINIQKRQLSYAEYRETFRFCNY